MSKPHSVAIAQVSGTRTLSPGQKKFNTLIQKIDIQRQLLLAWGEHIPLYQQRHAAEFVPLITEHANASVKLAHLLDERHDAKGLSKADRQLMSELICDIARNWMDGEREADMKALYNRHSDVDVDTEEQQSRNRLKAAIEQELGIDLGDDLDLAAPGELLQRMQEKMREKAEALGESAEGHPFAQGKGPFGSDPAHAARARTRRKPTAKQLKAQQEEAHISQSIREVYRKLASALHPDREPDSAERTRKTALMQRVNQAYDKRDLLALLQLQLEIEQIDQRALDGIAEDRLKHYNKVLAEQLSELMQEVQQVANGFKEQYGIHPGLRVTPPTLNRTFIMQKQDLQYDIFETERLLRELVDTTQLKRWLKERRQSANNVDSLVSMLDSFMDDKFR